MSLATTPLPFLSVYVSTVVPSGVLPNTVGPVTSAAARPPSTTRTRAPQETARNEVGCRCMGVLLFEEGLFSRLHGHRHHDRGRRIRPLDELDLLDHVRPLRRHRQVAYLLIAQRESEFRPRHV